MEVLAMERWSPYVVGVGIGVLSWLAFLLSDKIIGCSTAFARTAGMIEQVIAGGKVKEKAYYKKFPPVVDWEWMLVLGVLIGSYVSVSFSGMFSLEWVPPKWAEAAGAGAFTRWMAALAGGILIGFGARWAGGCTSGHGISGTLQLAVSSWLAAVSFFAGGILTAGLIYNVVLK
ncbi:YeeE/YedE thiosulfate transporter family protein [Pelotomaculum propionicicum]|uniref:YeeE/YedE thiosulfate transporter family protein n=1 Tax=Pelotomaculum propionicicum TaxID=258475 RepID=UPI003B7859ED